MCSTLSSKITFLWVKQKFSFIIQKNFFIIPEVPLNQLNWHLWGKVGHSNHLFLNVYLISFLPFLISPL